MFELKGWEGRGGGSDSVQGGSGFEIAAQTWN